MRPHRPGRGGMRSRLALPLIGHSGPATLLAAIPWTVARLVGTFNGPQKWVGVGVEQQVAVSSSPSTRDGLTLRNLTRPMRTATWIRVLPIVTAASLPVARSAVSADPAFPDFDLA